MGAPFHEQGKDNDKAYKKGDEDNGLDEGFDGRDLNKLGDCLIGTEPLTVCGGKGEGSSNDYYEQDGIGQIGPFYVDLPDNRFVKDP